MKVTITAFADLDKKIGELRRVYDGSAEILMSDGALNTVTVPIARVMRGSRSLKHILSSIGANNTPDPLLVSQWLEPQVRLIGLAPDDIKYDPDAGEDEVMFSIENDFVWVSWAEMFRSDDGPVNGWLLGTVTYDPGVRYRSDGSGEPPSCDPIEVDVFAPGEERALAERIVKMLFDAKMRSIQDWIGEALASRESVNDEIIQGGVASEIEARAETLQRMIDGVLSGETPSPLGCSPSTGSALLQREREHLLRALDKQQGVVLSP